MPLNDIHPGIAEIWIEEKIIYAHKKSANNTETYYLSVDVVDML